MEGRSGSEFAARSQGHLLSVRPPFRQACHILLKNSGPFSPLFLSLLLSFPCSTPLSFSLSPSPHSRKNNALHRLRYHYPPSNSFSFRPLARNEISLLSSSPFPLFSFSPPYPLSSILPSSLPTGATLPPAIDPKGRLSPLPCLLSSPSPLFPSPPSLPAPPFLHPPLLAQTSIAWHPKWRSVARPGSGALASPPPLPVLSLSLSHPQPHPLSIFRGKLYMNYIQLSNNIQYINPYSSTCYFFYIITTINNNDNNTTTTIIIVPTSTKKNKERKTVNHRKKKANRNILYTHIHTKIYIAFTSYFHNHNPYNHPPSSRTPRSSFTL